MRQVRERLHAEVSKVVVGQPTVIDMLLVAISVGGHALLEGVPGTAKTLTANAVARALGLDFNRVSFTPDMLPSDLTGTMTLRNGNLEFRQGPVHTHVLLADEINRTPPKTQSALLEAMAENQVTVDGQTRPLPEPFLVVATQNPVEHEGTYPLPEAQLDRFLVKIDVDYPTAEHETQMLMMARDGVRPATLIDVQPIASKDAILALKAQVTATVASQEVAAYVAAIVRKTRELPAVELGASPRAAVHLLSASRAAARISGRDFVTPDDIGRVAQAVLRHRILLRAEAELDRYTADDAVKAALAAVPVPR